MNNTMEFPNTFDEFAKEYGFKDSKEIYTNGSELIPVFRVKQWLEHIECEAEDCISRQSVLNRTTIVELDDGHSFTMIAPEEIRTLPSVYPKSGKSDELIDKLDKLRFFNQRAGRELWQDKPVYIQNLDIADVEETLTEAINYIRSYPKSDKSVLEDIKAEINDSVFLIYHGDKRDTRLLDCDTVLNIIDNHISGKERIHE